MKEFIYDFFALSSEDIEKWSKNFFWPVSTKKTQKILIDILDIFHCNIKKEDDFFIKDCLITYNQNFNPYIILFNYILLKERINKMKLKLKCSDQSKVMKYLFEVSDEFPIKVEDFQNNKNNDLLRILKDNLKTIKFNLSHGKIIPQYFVSAVNQKGVLEQEYFKNIEEWVNILSVERLKKNYKHLEIPKKLEVVVNLIHHQYLEYGKKKLKISIPDYVKEDILKYQLKYFRNIYSLLKCLSKNKVLKKTKKLFIDYPKTALRAISLIVKKNGGHIYGFPHGSWICHSLSKKPVYNEYLIFDYYFIYNNSQKILFLDNLKNNSPNSSIKFISQNSKIFSNYKSKYEYKVPIKITSIMILEHQLWCDDIRFDLPETMIMFEFFYYLCTILSSMGYKIYFKKRPKSQTHRFDFFKNIKNIEFIDGDLQDKNILALGDIIVFMYGQSSTFLPLICSNKKLIYFDNGWENWNPKVYKLLKKRCKIIKTFNNKKNQIRFRSVDLVNSLKFTKNNIDRSIYHNFLSIDDERK